MRTSTKMQILAAVMVGFFLGYVFLPSLSPSPSDGESPAGPNTAWRYAQGKGERTPRGPAIQISKDGEDFVIDGKPKRILSGAMHYFRVVPAYWEDRMRKLLAAGLNTVET